jgi:DeoR/GlpR family transcriptional regulator of sugar metabolism
MLRLMKAPERHLRILELFSSEEFIDSESLCQKLKASESSVRRDLIALERRGSLRRVHGGAVSLQSSESLQESVWQSNRYSAEKQRIGKATAELVEDGQTVILDGGSTVAEVARQLQGRSIQIITNSIPIAEIFYDSKTAEVTLTGGFLYPRLGVLLGPLCEQMLQSVAADVLIMGIGGITETGLSNSNSLIVGSERKMIEVSRRVIVVADHSKFGRSAMVHLATLEQVDLVVSDLELSSNFRDLLESRGVQTRLV